MRPEISLSDSQTAEHLVVRSLNPFGSRLSESTCVFRVLLEQEKFLHPSDEAIDAFLALGGSFTLEDHPGGSSLQLTIPHARMDAFGGIFVLSESKIARNSISLQRSDHGGIEFESASTTILHRWRKGSIRTNHVTPATFTQKLCRSIVLSLPDVPSVDVCVAFDDLSRMSLDQIGGNSLGIVKVDSRRLLSLSNGQRDAWALFLRKRGERALKFISSEGQSAASPILVSSLGDLGKFPWFSLVLHPSVFTMFPTPAPGALNAISWCVDGVQAIQVGWNNADEILLKDKAEKVLQAWEGLFDE